MNFCSISVFLTQVILHQQKNADIKVVQSFSHCDVKKTEVFALWVATQNIFAVFIFVILANFLSWKNFFLCNPIKMLVKLMFTKIIYFHLDQ